MVESVGFYRPAPASARRPAGRGRDAERGELEVRGDRAKAPPDPTRTIVQLGFGRSSSPEARRGDEKELLSG